jgi:hypothetical protein
MGLNVIGVTVDAERVVCQYGVRPESADVGDNPFDQFVEGCVAERGISI